jgi:hypothetical protein
MRIQVYNHATKFCVFDVPRHKATDLIDMCRHSGYGTDEGLEHLI